MSVLSDPFQVVPAAVSFWESALKVRRMDATVRLNRKCENNQYFLSPGDPTQFCKNRCVETKGAYIYDVHLKRRGTRVL